MLKYIFMDINPYIVNLNEIYEPSWKEVIQIIENEYPNLVSLDVLKDLIRREPYIIDQNTQWLDEIGQDKYNIIAKILKDKAIDNLSKYVKSHPINPILSTFFADAADDNVKIILVTSNFMLTSIDKLYELPKNVSVESIEASTYLVSESLVDYASKNDLTCDEFTCITQVDATIKDVSGSNIFCITINTNKKYDNDKILYLNSIEDLIFSNIKYNFYANSDLDSDL